MICQDPGNPRKRIYRVFKCIEDSKGSIEETGHQLKGHAKVSNNKAVRDSLGAVITNKAASATDPMFVQLAIEDGQVGEPPKKKTKREPKKKSPEEEAAQKQQRDFDNSMKGNLISN